MTAVWPDGATFVYQATIINGAAIATPTCTLTPGAGNEFELYYGAISHDDVTASDIDVRIRDDGARILANLYDVDAVTQNSICRFPPAPGVSSTSGNDAPAASRFMVSGTMDLFLRAVDIDANEGITVAIVGRIFGSTPDVAETAGGTPTITKNTERTF